MNLLVLCTAFAITLTSAPAIALECDAQQIHKLLADDGADEFGTSIAVADGVVAVGAIGDDDNGEASGSVYLFDAATGAQIAKLLPDDGAAGDWFGRSIALADGIVAVGAQENDDNGKNSGSAYLFDASTGAQLAKLLPDDGQAGAIFGRSIALADGIVAVGAKFDDDNGLDSGSAYLFDAATGVQIHKLLPDDGESGDEFGTAIAIANGVVAVGAQEDDDSGEDSGSAYLFDATTGAQIHKLLPDDGGSGHEFGDAIAIADGIVAVGAALDDDNGTESGSAYLFDAATGAQIAKLLPDDGQEFEWFGRSIAIANCVVAVGAPFDYDNSRGSGSAYLFDAATGAQIIRILPADGEKLDLFGESIAIADGYVAMGAPFDFDNAATFGSAYLFEHDCAPATPGDLDGDGVVDVSDLLALLGEWGDCDDPENCPADIDGNGIVDTTDLLTLLANWG